ncbi:hypothetical protein ACJX0J_034036 [Zea mays]
MFAGGSLNSLNPTASNNIVYKIVVLVLGKIILLILTLICFFGSSNLVLNMEYKKINISMAVDMIVIFVLVILNVDLLLF